MRIRHTDRPLDRMLAYDRKLAVVPVDPSESVRGALVIRQPGLLAGMIHLFEEMRDSAEGISKLLAPEDDQALSQADTWRDQIAAGAVFDTAASTYNAFGDAPEAAAIWWRFAARWGRWDPHGPSALQDRVPAAYRPTQPVTNAGLFGWMMGQNAQLAGFAINSGHPSADGDRVDGGPAPLQRAARSFASNDPAAWDAGPGARDAQLPFSGGSSTASPLV